MTARRDRLRRRPAGFTLVEMVAVLVIVAVLAAAARPLLVFSAQRAQETALRQALRTLRGALDAYHDAAVAGRIVQPAGSSGWPPSLQVLVQGVPLAEDPRQRLYLLRRLPRDPMADAALPPAETWGLRASDSPPEAPRAGRDVFDVHSLSPRRALDGSAYRDW